MGEVVGVQMFFPDPILDISTYLDMKNDPKGTGIICSHCQKEIKGKIHRWGAYSYDTYCWNLRFILGSGDEEELRKEELRRFLAQKGILD
ncbi:MAG: hypothetical protein U9R75_02055 [Candidatus Thermoplasmatota archaeon]|nr:hypothetical protein [Candidatus Thermoplasmatota archaeon]